ncbi:MAG TPA: S-layer homology domain-containing protein [Anaerolineales bacterium]|nr:S-layer homology domain-containing protein [Anaerolineales bacterium]
MKTNLKTNFKKTFYVLCAIALSLLLIMPQSLIQAQDEAPPPPLIPQLTWDMWGSGERSFDLNGTNITLPGQVYHAQEEFNLDDSEEIATYYASTNMKSLGWQFVNTSAKPNGNISLYYQDGYFARVEFIGCESDYTISCLTVWVSQQTEIRPQHSDPSSVQPATGTLKKTSPANGNTLTSTSVTFSWTSYTGQNLSHYRYCYDTNDNSKCDIQGGWTSVWSGTSVSITVPNGATYYWQVQAVLDDSTKVDADSGSWWKFIAPPAAPPTAFNKTLPYNGVSGQSITPTLAWQSSSNVSSYEYCLDTVNNNICDNNWISAGTNTYLTLFSGIAPDVTYYWQVRAVNSYGVMYANTNSWASFKTATGPINDSIDSATSLSIPFEASLPTTAATLDLGTTSACSPGLGYASVWYKYSTSTGRKLYLDTFGSAYDTFIAVWTKNANETLNAVTCNNNSGSSLQSVLTLTPSNGITYYIQIAQLNPASAPTLPPGGTLVVHVNTFLDVNNSSPYHSYIEKIYAHGIASGCATSPDVLYCPTSSVTRAQMSVFILRSIHGSSYTPPGVGGGTGFADVPADYWAAAWIKQLAAEGITGGCGTGLYCPENAVTRDQMAVFLLKAKHGSAYTPPAVGGSTGFSDVPIDYWSAAWIKQLATEGISTGCSTGVFCPSNAVTREQMAVFLVRAFNIP